MITPATRRRRAHLALAAALCGTAALAAVLYRFPPGQYGFYPVCPIHAYTGLLCPGCGMTRALAALVHGHLAEAMRWNPLVVLVVVGLPTWGVAAYRRALAAQPMSWPRLPNSALAALLLMAGVFMVLRNIPR